MFNDSTIPNQIKSGQLRKKVVHQAHPSPLRSGQPDCTYSQILSFWDSEGNKVAVCHQYKRPDGAIGGSGRADPKRIMVGDTIFFV